MKFIILIIFAIFINGCESHGWRSVDHNHHREIHYIHYDHHYYHDHHYRNKKRLSNSYESKPLPSRKIAPPRRPISPPSRSITKGVPQPTSREPSKKE